MGEVSRVGRAAGGLGRLAPRGCGSCVPPVGHVQAARVPWDYLPVPAKAIAAWSLPSLSCSSHSSHHRKTFRLSLPPAFHTRSPFSSPPLGWRGDESAPRGSLAVLSSVTGARRCHHCPPAAGVRPRAAPLPLRRFPALARGSSSGKQQRFSRVSYPLAGSHRQDPVLSTGGAHRAKILLKSRRCFWPRHRMSVRVASQGLGGQVGHSRGLWTSTLGQRTEGNCPHGAQCCTGSFFSCSDHHSCMSTKIKRRRQMRQASCSSWIA